MVLISMVPPPENPSKKEKVFAWLFLVLYIAGLTIAIREITINYQQYQYEHSIKK